MKCADPILCYSSEGKRIFRHYSLASPIIKMCHTLVLECGQCLQCRKKRARELAMRCVLQASLYEQNCFLTLTYDEEKNDYHNRLQYSDIQKFKKNLRRHCEYHEQKKIQLFNVHEYGKNGKKHWHLVVFNHDFKDKTLYTVKNGNNLYHSNHLSKLWTHGYHTIGSVTEASAMYQAQYMQKDIKNGNTKENGRTFHSKHSGIGRDYFLKYYRQILSLNYIPFNGRKVPIPRYFQKIAHKHYSHYYEKANFFDTKDRKKLYTPFRNNEANKELADLYAEYKKIKEIKVEELTNEWQAYIHDYDFSKEKTDFQKSYENYLYDLKNKIPNSNF